jgi:hypothetical protein
MINFIHVFDFPNTWHFACSPLEHITKAKGVIDEDADRYDVQESSCPKDSTTSFHLQALWRPDLFTRFLESPSRGAPQKRPLEWLD